MADQPTNKISFSAGRRWGIFFSVIVSIVAVCALVLMLNYLGARHYVRVELSGQTAMPLSSQTIALLKYVTNEVRVVVYYDKSDPLYGSVVALLDEYRLTNPKITVEKVDYLKDAARAQEIKDAFKLGAVDDKNLVIFAANGRRKAIPEELLGDYDVKNTGQTTDKGAIMYDRQLKGFAGEKWFSAAILSVINDRQLLACFLEGHGEATIADREHEGYEKFGEILVQNNIEPGVVRLHGTNMIPPECNLLIIPGPRTTIPADELAKISDYLKQGGRMMVLFNYNTKNFNTGLEKILADWNVTVGMNILTDPDNTLSGGALVVNHFNANHAIVSPLVGSSVEMLAPRSIQVLNQSAQGPETPHVASLAFSGPRTIASGNATPGTFSMMVAVEKAAVKGVVSPRGTTAILAVGDSMLFDNDLIEAMENRELAGFSLNWLLDQTQLLQGVGSHPVREYKLAMTGAQLASVRLLFLVIVPGSILAFGGLVWFRRRH